MRKANWCLAMRFAALVLTVSVASAGEAELTQVKREWPTAARRLDQQFARVQGTARIWQKTPDRPGAHMAHKKLFVTKARFAVDHGMQKVEFSRFDVDAEQTKLREGVLSVGNGTAFELGRRAEAASYSVSGIGTTEKEHNRYTGILGRFLSAHNGINGMPITQFIESPGFKISDATTVNEGETRLMMVDCLSGQGETAAQASFVLDPGAGWVVRSCRLSPINDRKELTAYDVEYNTTHDGPPLPRLVKLTTRRGLQYCEFSDWRFVGTPLSEFNMTYYGLPDMVAAKGRRTLPYWIIGNIAIVSLIAAIGLWRTASRSRLGGHA